MRTPAPHCSACRRALRSTEVLYSERGDMVCQSCTTAIEVAAGHEASALTARNVAYSNPLLGLAAFVFDPLCLVSIGAIGNGLYVLRRLRAEGSPGEPQAPDARRRKLAAASGMLLGAAALVFRLFW